MMSPNRSASVRVAVLALGIALLSVAPLPAAESPAPGLAVGQKAPAFTLKDQAGQERSLSEFLGEGYLGLVFYRSADW